MHIFERICSEKKQTCVIFSGKWGMMQMWGQHTKARKKPEKPKMGLADVALGGQAGSYMHQRGSEKRFVTWQCTDGQAGIVACAQLACVETRDF